MLIALKLAVRELLWPLAEALAADRRPDCVTVGEPITSLSRATHAWPRQYAALVAARIHEVDAAAPAERAAFEGLVRYYAAQLLSALRTTGQAELAQLARSPHLTPDLQRWAQRQLVKSRAKRNGFAVAYAVLVLRDAVRFELDQLGETPDELARLHGSDAMWHADMAYAAHAEDAEGEYDGLSELRCTALIDYADSVRT